MNSSCFMLLLFLSLPLVSFAHPNERALNIALKAEHPKTIHKALIDMVKTMKPGEFITKKLLKDTLSLLEAPGYEAFEFKIAKGDSKKILKELREKSSFESAEWAKNNSQLFPSFSSIPLLAATGSVWNGHHVYPGGLVYHLYTTAQTNLKLLETYEKAYKHSFSQKEKDLVVLSGIWHDAAKIYTMTWKEDGTLTAKEGKIAGTGSHHVFSAAEALVRGHSKELVMAIAGSHDPATEGSSSYQKVIDYLAAASIVAGKSLEDVGLQRTAEGITYIKKPSLYMFIQHLGDADAVLTSQALPVIRKVLNEKVSEWIAVQGEEEINWLINSLLATQGEVVPYHLWQRDGEKSLKKYVLSTAKKMGYKVK